VHDLLAAIESSADEAVAAARVATGPAGTWTPATVIGHLADVDDVVWQPRLRTMVEAHRAGSEPPRFVWWEPDGEATADRYQGMSAEEAGERLRVTRGVLLAELRALRPGDWHAVAHHATFGQLTVEGLLRELLAHDALHRGSLR
jgi:hypothetical protein